MEVKTASVVEWGWHKCSLANDPLFSCMCVYQRVLVCAKCSTWESTVITPTGLAILQCYVHVDDKVIGCFCEKHKHEVKSVSRAEANSSMYFLHLFVNSECFEESAHICSYYIFMLSSRPRRLIHKEITTSHSFYLTAERRSTRRFASDGYI